MNPIVEKRILWETKIRWLLYVIPISIIFYWIAGAFDAHNMSRSYYNAKNGPDLFVCSIVLTMLLFWFSTKISCYQAAGTETKEVIRGLSWSISLIAIMLAITTQTVVKANKACRIERVIQQAELHNTSDHGQNRNLVEDLKANYLSDFHKMRGEEVDNLIKAVAEASKQ